MRIALTHSRSVGRLSVSVRYFTMAESTSKGKVKVPQTVVVFRGKGERPLPAAGLTQLSRAYSTQDVGGIAKRARKTTNVLQPQPTNTMSFIQTGARKLAEIQEQDSCVRSAISHPLFYMVDS